LIRNGLLSLFICIKITMRNLVFVFLSFCFIEAFAQSNNEDTLRITEGRYDSIFHIYVLPSEALNGNYNLVVENFNIEPDTTKPKPGIKITWGSPFIRGKNVLIINPRQIFLKTEHENPYYDYLFWIINIDTSQYYAIRDFLKSNHIPRLTNQKSPYSRYSIYSYENNAVELTPPDDWTDQVIAKHSKDYKYILFKNFCSILNILNKPLSRKKEKIIIPSSTDFMKIKSVRIVLSMEQWGDQVKAVNY
jgi:hypothetical protein